MQTIPAIRFHLGETITRNFLETGIAYMLTPAMQHEAYIVGHRHKIADWYCGKQDEYDAEIIISDPLDEDSYGLLPEEGGRWNLLLEGAAPLMIVVFKRI